jgi:hypothetical protein
VTDVQFAGLVVLICSALYLAIDLYRHCRRGPR